MRSAWPWTVFVASFFLAELAAAQLGGLLDRARRKAEEAAAEVRDVRRDVETATDVERAADAEVARTRVDVENAVPTEQRLEQRLEREVESTEPVRAARSTERRADAIATTDERAAAAATAEMRRAETDLERQTDVEGRARRAAEQTDAAVEARRVEREAHAVSTADERAAAEFEREVGGLQRAIDRATDID